MTVKITSIPSDFIKRSRVWATICLKVYYDVLRIFLFAEKQCLPNICKHITPICSSPWRASDREILALVQRLLSRWIYTILSGFYLRHMVYQIPISKSELITDPLTCLQGATSIQEVPLIIKRFRCFQITPRTINPSRSLAHEQIRSNL